ncbi:hypothetical protein WR25_03422 [Diploscapter pachys]|uniref:Phospholipid scramblase n=1 Tax=Diploscapter pachys TaxID=2018661 RepID=A0A2A2J6W3_9BILA|nr:hypothetical protein WR25_03422 [Diploscapter pachys]
MYPMPPGTITMQPGQTNGMGQSMMMGAAMGAGMGMINGGMMGVGTDGLPIVGAGMGLIAEMADDMHMEQQMGGPVVAMNVPAPMPGVPLGLEYLTMLDLIMVHQKMEIIEMVAAWETKNKYVLKNANAQQVYFAFEESDMCERQMCGPKRGWTMHIVDNFKRLGQIRQKQAGCASCFVVVDSEGKEIFTIDGPCCCMMCCCSDKEFPVATIDGNVIGAVTKKWSGCFREGFTDADVFSVTFPRDLDVKMKAILVGATFLIDFMEFEQVQRQKQH